MTVNKVNMRKWVKALRSGKYAQGKSLLAAVGSDGEIRYCCLGVACRVAEAEGVVPPGVLDRDDETVSWDGESYTLPPRVRAWLGLADEGLEGDVLLNRPGQVLPGTAKKVWATTANDSLDWSFEDIATALEARYLT